jgi:LysM repeat protein
VAGNSKAYLLGLILMNYMGADVLRVAVKTLGSEIKKAPKLHVKDITKEISKNEGEEVAVDYEVSAEDAEDNPITPSCNPPSGSTFPVGQTIIVTCEAKDDKTGLTTRESFDVTLTPKLDYFIYTVQKGDTIDKIAERFHTTGEVLVQLNNIPDRDFIEVGQRLRIPK